MERDGAAVASGQVRWQAMNDPFSSLVGQDAAVNALQAAIAHPVHAYMFVGPEGVGKRVAALTFASLLLGDERALHETHPDLVVVEREGASINVAQAREIARLASLSPVEGARKVIVLTEFHLVDEAAPALLKTIEEASQSTVFIILAESVTRELVTVASRCVKVEFAAIPEELVASTLVVEGVEPARASQAAAAAFGNLDRARLLAVDDEVATRHQLWVEALGRLNRTGAAVGKLVEDIVASLDHASAPLLQRQSGEVAAIQSRIKETGVSATALKNLETRHKREQRRLRADELRAGLSTLAQEVSKPFVDATDKAGVVRTSEAISTLNWANDALRFNPNETLLLQGLFVRLSA